jgi:hypothetical protein
MYEENEIFEENLNFYKDGNSFSEFNVTNPQKKPVTVKSMVNDFLSSISDTGEKNPHLSYQETITGPQAHNQYISESLTNLLKSIEKKKNRTEIDYEIINQSAEEKKTISTKDTIIRSEYEKQVSNKTGDNKISPPTVKFNNLVKSILIYTICEELQKFNVIDLACGGTVPDSWKFRVFNCNYTCIDNLNSNGLYSKIKQSKSGDKWNSRKSIDSTFNNLNLSSFSNKIDFVNCQFAIHYACITENVLKNVFQNVSKCLKVNGYFLITTVDSNVVLKYLKKFSKYEKELFFSNSFCVVKFKEIPTEKFGSSYTFTMGENIKGIDEYLIHQKSFEDMAKKNGFDIVLNQNFQEFGNTHFETYNKFSNFKRICIPKNHWDVIGLYKIYLLRRI